MNENSIESNLHQILSAQDVYEEGNSLDYIEKSMERDLILIKAIQSGDKAGLEKVMNLPDVSTSEVYYYANPIIREDLLRTRKNGMVIRNTLCRIGGALGGVPAVYLHLVSEKYGIQIEEATSIDYLENTLSSKMLYDFYNLVINFSTAKYSTLIKQIVSYIGNHLAEELSVTILADLFHVNSSHLARKFKKETGYTVSEYVNKQKVAAAKLLLQRNEMTISQIAESLGYNSSSYFSKVFKKVTGKAPSDYLST